MGISESKKKIVIDNYFKRECDVNTSIKEAFTKGFELGLKKASISSVEPKDSEDKIIRQTLENFMRGLWEEMQVGELEYTTSEVYEMLDREIFTKVIKGEAM